MRLRWDIGQLRIRGLKQRFGRMLSHYFLSDSVACYIFPCVARNSPNVNLSCQFTLSRRAEGIQSSTILDIRKIYRNDFTAPRRNIYRLSVGSAGLSTGSTGFPSDLAD